MYYQLLYSYSFFSVIQVISNNLDQYFMTGKIFDGSQRKYLKLEMHLKYHLYWVTNLSSPLNKTTGEEIELYNNWW